MAGSAALSINFFTKYRVIKVASLKNSRIAMAKENWAGESHFV